MAADTRPELDERVRRSGIVFQEMRDAPDHEIPGDLLARSRCVAVVPNVIKAAWILGGRYGTGVLSCRGKNGDWSPPVFVMMTGGSFGLQFGASSTDVVLFFMTYEGVRSVLNNKVKLSGDAAVAAGPVGREAEAATDGEFRAQIYSYARSRGLFAGVSLSGAYLGVNVEDTSNYYGKSYPTTGILFDGQVTSVPKSTWSFLGALPRPHTATAKKPTNSKSRSAKAAPKPAAKSNSTASAKVGPGGVAPGPPAAAGARGGADAGGEAWGTAAAGGDTLGGQAWGTASGEASGTASANPPPVQGPPPSP
jgi:lipid-binding SYLF domain-containing protein